MTNGTYPVQFSVDYPERPLNRLTTLLRIFVAVPILIVVGSVSGSTWQWSTPHGGQAVVAGAGGLLFFAPLLLILFRQKYPRWWFDWNLELQRFSNRVGVYLALMEDRYPSTDEHQSVHLDYEYPDAERDLNRWLPLVKWLLAIPHYIVLFFLYIAAVVVVIVAWFAILFTGRYPSGMFHFVEGVIRWNNRVLAYALLLVTDQYPRSGWPPDRSGAGGGRGCPAAGGGPRPPERGPAISSTFPSGQAGACDRPSSGSSDTPCGSGRVRPSCTRPVRVAGSGRGPGNAGWPSRSRHRPRRRPAGPR